MTGLNCIDLYRRIDWRFLLPRPVPQRVGYVGEPGTILAALQRVAQVTLILPASATQDARNDLFDLVVVSSSRLEEISKAVCSVAPAGMLYWEIRSSSRSIHRPVRFLRRMGFSDIQLFWHRPDFENCREIVPIDTDALVRFVKRGSFGLRRKLAVPAAWCLVNAKILPQMISSLAILALRDEDDHE